MKDYPEWMDVTGDEDDGLAMHDDEPYDEECPVMTLEEMI